MIKNLSQINRRQFVGQGIRIGAGAWLLPSLIPGLARHAWSQSAQPAPGAQDDHFFLLITTQPGAGIDGSYLFDARPLDMTAKGLIQNYRKPSEPTRWDGSNGVSTLATELVAPLAPYQPYFSVLNGVTMATGFDGHDQNVNYVFAGDPFGGESFVPHLNLLPGARRPLDAVEQGYLKATLTNTNGIVPVTASGAQSFISSLRKLPPLDPTSSLFRHLRQRFEAVGQLGGSLGAGSDQMKRSFDETPGLARMLSGLDIETSSDPADLELTFVKMIAKFFAAGVARGAVLSLEMDSIAFDTHDPGSAAKQPETYAKLSGTLASILKTMRETPYDSTRSLMDVTTFMFTSEFGRTMRQSGKPMDKTGTDHNPLTNTVLIGGKGIRGGQVIGSSDYASAGEKLSKAHLSLDQESLKVMGRPFDFATSRSRTDLPEAYKAADYLGFNSVINTIYSKFGIKGHMRLTERNGDPASIIAAL